MDEKFLEQASDLAQARRDDALRDARAQLQGPGQSDCDGCGEPIPAARRAALPGAICCVACQHSFETLKRTTQWI